MMFKKSNVIAPTLLSLSIGVSYFAGSIAIAAATEDATSNKTSSSGTGTAANANSANDSANKAESINRTGQVMSLAFGGMFISEAYTHGTKCAAHSWGDCPWAVIKAGMAVMSFQQSKANGSVAGAASLTASLTDGLDTGSSSLTGSDTTKYPEIAGIPSLLNKMKTGSGSKVTVDLEKGTVSDGENTYSSSDFASAGSMKAAGFSQSDIDKVMADAKAAEKSIVARSGLGSDSFGDGGGGGTTTVVVEEDPMGGHGFGGGRGVAAASTASAANVAGMSKDYNGEPIGVAGDSIFDMMTRRYNVKKKQDTFLNEAEALLNK